METRKISLPPRDDLRWGQVSCTIQLYQGWEEKPAITILSYNSDTPRLSDLELMCVMQPSLFAAGPSMEAKPLNGAEVSQWVGRTFKRMQQVKDKECYSLDPMLIWKKRGKAQVISHLPWGHLNKEQSSLGRSWETIGLWQNEVEEDRRWAANPEQSSLWDVLSPSLAFLMLCFGPGLPNAIGKQCGY